MSCPCADQESTKLIRFGGTPGTLRKSTLGTVTINDSGHASLLAHYNIALGTMRALRPSLEDLARG